MRIFAARLRNNDAKSTTKQRNGYSSSNYFRVSPKWTTDERRSNLLVVRSEDGKSNEGMTEKMKKSSLTILRENNRGKRKEDQ